MNTLFPWISQRNHHPLSFVSGEGPWLMTETTRYLDFSSQLMVTNLGHQHPYVKAAIAKQLDQLAFIQPSHTTAVREAFASALIPHIGPGKFFITTGGSEAVENAIKIARMVTGKQKILTRYRSYHGATTGALSLSGDARRHAIAGAEMPGVIRVEDPYCFRCPWGQIFPTCDRLCISHIERIIAFEGPDSIAAIVMEGASGSSGCLTYPPEYWPALRKLADKYGILLIADEIMSGFCRTGRWFGFQAWNVMPDMVVMAKGLTCGMVPMGAVWASSQVADFFDDHPLHTGLTYAAHPLGCAAALACVELYEKESVADRVAKQAELLVSLFPKLDIVGDARGVGFLQCIELVNPDTKAPLFQSRDDEKLLRLQAAFLAEKILIFMRGHYVFVAPPLLLSDEVLTEGMMRIQRVLTAFRKMLSFI